MAVTLFLWSPKVSHDPWLLTLDPNGNVALSRIFIIIIFFFQKCPNSKYIVFSILHGPGEQLAEVLFYSL